MAVLASEVKPHLPAEWMPQSGIMLTWPHPDTIWADTLSMVDPIFAKIAKEISLREKVLITCYDKQHEGHITALLQRANVNLSQVRLFEAPSNDVWVRDHGPISIIQGKKIKLLDFTFNGWGNKYPAENDNRITELLHRQKAFGEIERLAFDLVLEGGGIEVDGEGTLLATKSCLLAKTRNPFLRQADLEERLKMLFGLNRILWLDHGFLEGDDTDGHVDTLARFTDAKTICYQACDDKKDPHYQALKAMEDQLKTFKNFMGEPYRLFPLPWPKERHADYDGRRLPLSYANFLIINEAVLAPTYEDERDELALTILKACFPDRKIIPVSSLPIVQWYGSIHCMTMQLPQGISL